MKVAAKIGACRAGARAVRAPCDRTAVALQARDGKSKAPAAPGGGLFPAFWVRVRVPCRGVGARARTLGLGRRARAGSARALGLEAGVSKLEGELAVILLAAILGWLVGGWIGLGVVAAIVVWLIAAAW